MTNTANSVKKSNFVEVTTVPSGSTFDFVVSGTNKKISLANLIAQFGTVGTIQQEGEITGIAVLHVDGTTNNIRNILGGSGILASLSPGGAVQLDHNFTIDDTGVALVTGGSDTSPVFRSMQAGSGINVSTSGDVIQISSTVVPASTKTIVINELSDLPAAVLGVIPLEDDTQYLFTNDVTTPNRFSLGSNTVVKGSDGTLINLVYTGTDAMFTGENVTSKITDLVLTCATGSLIDMTGTSTELFQLINCTVVSCDEIGSVEDMYVVNFQNVVWSNIITDGLSVVSTAGIVSVFQNIVTVNGGSFIDLGTATLSGLNISNSVGIFATGTYGISGAADSANITAGGLGSIINTRTFGTGAALNGITTSDALWTFKHNAGIPDSRTTALAINTGMTVTIAAADTPVKIDSDWTEIESDRFTTTSAGVFTYNGVGDHVSMTASITAAGTGGADDCTFYFYKNGAQIANSGVQREFTAGDPGNISLVWADELATDDYIEVWAENNDDTSNITIVKIILRFD